MRNIRFYFYEKSFESRKMHRCKSIKFLWKFNSDSRNIKLALGKKNISKRIFGCISLHEALVLKGPPWRASELGSMVFHGRGEIDEERLQRPPRPNREGVPWLTPYRENHGTSGDTPVALLRGIESDERSRKFTLASRHSSTNVCHVNLA